VKYLRSLPHGSELKKFGRGETRSSLSDLKALEQRHARTVVTAETARMPRQNCLPTIFSKQGGPSPPTLLSKGPANARHRGLERLRAKGCR